MHSKLARSWMKLDSKNISGLCIWTASRFASSTLNAPITNLVAPSVEMSPGYCKFYEQKHAFDKLIILLPYTFVSTSHGTDQLELCEVITDSHHPNLAYHW